MPLEGVEPTTNPVFQQSEGKQALQQAAAVDFYRQNNYKSQADLLLSSPPFSLSPSPTPSLSLSLTHTHTHTHTHTMAYT